MAGHESFVISLLLGVITQGSISQVAMLFRTAFLHPSRWVMVHHTQFPRNNLLKPFPLESICKQLKVMIVHWQDQYTIKL